MVAPVHGDHMGGFHIFFFEKTFESLKEYAIFIPSKRLNDGSGDHSTTGPKFRSHGRMVDEKPHLIRRPGLQNSWWMDGYSPLNISNHSQSFTIIHNHSSYSSYLVSIIVGSKYGNNFIIIPAPAHQNWLALPLCTNWGLPAGHVVEDGRDWLREWQNYEDWGLGRTLGSGIFGVLGAGRLGSNWPCGCLWLVIVDVGTQPYSLYVEVSINGGTPKSSKK